VGGDVRGPVKANNERDDSSSSESGGGVDIRLRIRFLVLVLSVSVHGVVNENQGDLVHSKKLTRLD
jgi:hypothetical protein